MKHLIIKLEKQPKDKAELKTLTEKCFSINPEQLEEVSSVIAIHNRIILENYALLDWYRVSSNGSDAKHTALVIEETIHKLRGKIDLPCCKKQTSIVEHHHLSEIFSPIKKLPTTLPV
jgi:hypothetical protein